MSSSFSRRSFLSATGLGVASLGLSRMALAQAAKDGELIQGFEQAATTENTHKDWKCWLGSFRKKELR